MIFCLCPALQPALVSRRGVRGAVSPSSERCCCKGDVLPSLPPSVTLRFPRRLFLFTFGRFAHRVALFRIDEVICCCFGARQSTPLSARSKHLESTAAAFISFPKPDKTNCFLVPIHWLRLLENLIKQRSTSFSYIHLLINMISKQHFLLSKSDGFGRKKKQRLKPTL